MAAEQKLEGGPLAGVRVVDLTSLVMGPYCTQILADMGADVIKVEPPGGDDVRVVSVGPTPQLSGVFVNVNRGKRSVVLDLKQPAAREALRALIAGADLFIHSMRAKAIAGLGFDYEAVRAIRPDIVYVNCYGYSRRGPAADRAAYDDTIQAECGLLALQERLTGQPGFVGTIIADKVAGLTATYATMMALFHRQRTGEGQEVEIGMFETMASFVLVEHANGAMFTPPLGPAVYPRAASPMRRPYPTKDGHIAALVYNDRHWRSFLARVDADWLRDPRFATLRERSRHIEEIYQKLAGLFATRTSAEWLGLLREASIPCAALNTPDDLFEDEHLEAIGFFETVESDHGPIRFPGVPTWLSRTPGHVRGPAPGLGQHSGEVLTQAGLPADLVAANLRGAAGG